MILILLTVLPAGFGVVAAEGLQEMGLSAFLSWTTVIILLIIWVLGLSVLKNLKRYPEKGIKKACIIKTNSHEHTQRSLFASGLFVAVFQTFVLNQFTCNS